MHSESNGNNLRLVGVERESARLFLSSGSSLLRHALKETWFHFLLPAELNGAILFLDDLQNITTVSKAGLALMIRDQFQRFGVEGMITALASQLSTIILPKQRPLAEPAVRFYTKLYLEPFTFQETLEYTRSAFGLPLDISEKAAEWLHEKTLGHAYFLASICKYLPQRSRLSLTSSKQIGPRCSANWAARSSVRMFRN